MAPPEFYSHHESDSHKHNSGSHTEDQNVQCYKQPFGEKGLPVKADEAADIGAVNDDSVVLLPCVPQNPTSKHKDFAEKTSDNTCGAPCPQSCSNPSGCWTNQVLSKCDSPSPANAVKHNSRKDYQCVVCLKNFDSPSKLSRHFLIHTGMKPFQCPFCAKASHLKCHQRIHTLPITGLGIFSCTHCHMVFFTEQELELHSCTCRGDMSVVKGSPYQCAVCFKDFRAPSKLKRHFCCPKLGAPIHVILDGV
uniref:C2H2-type domain-containing protein n=1 Tax=Scleropages formosus TaxID=113540 RepID=A0A8C9W731_SCLFO